MEEQRFSEEIERIFLKGMFVDSGYRLLRKNDYHSFLIGKHPVVVRNGTVYDNVCDHRLSLIHPLGYGNQEFVCGYHGKDQSHAKQYPHYRYKNLLFVGERDPSMVSLLDKYNYKANNHFFHYELKINANWKLFVENVIEYLHVKYVHKESQNILKPFLSLDHIPEQIRYGKHSVERIISEAPQRYRKYIDEWKWENIYIFPNLFVSNVSNIVTFVSYFIPEKYNETTVIYEGYFNKEGMDERIADVIKTSAKNFVPAILSEDKPFIESCQYGVTSRQGKYSPAYTKYLLEEEEKRIEWFLEALNYE
jgi:phenylpropionate dioxygenase-like ring-hydroxylating dioxygenase large terminal subunit